MIICLFSDEVRFYCASASVVSQPMLTVYDSTRYTNNPNGHHCTLSFEDVIKVARSARQEARMYLCDNLLDKW